METIIHSLSDGRRITVRIKRNARKNIILRPMAADVVSATIPRCRRGCRSGKIYCYRCCRARPYCRLKKACRLNFGCMGSSWIWYRAGMRAYCCCLRVSVWRKPERRSRRSCCGESGGGVLPRHCCRAWLAMRAVWNSNLRQWLCRMPKLSGVFAAVPRGYVSTGGWSARPILWWTMFACMSFAIFRIRTTAAIFGVWSTGIRRTRRQPSCG